LDRRLDKTRCEFRLSDAKGSLSIA